MQTTLIAPVSGIDTMVKNIIVEKIGFEGYNIPDQALFKNDLGIDSLDFCEILQEMENKFGVNIPDEDAENLQTVGSLIAYIKEKK